MKIVTCKSGIKGWQARLHEVYDSFEEFARITVVHNIHVRLGFKNLRRCWLANPIVQGSVIPSDLRRIREEGPKFNKTLLMPKFDGLRAILYRNGPHLTTKL